MQTEVATDDTQDSPELEARKRSGQKWRWRIIWLPIALSILMVPGCIAAPIFDPNSFAVPDGEDAVFLALFLEIFSIIFPMPPMLFLAWLAGRPFIYRAPKLFFMVIGVAIGLLIVIGCYWVLAGGIFIAGASSGSEEAGAGLLFGAIIVFVIMPALAIAAVVGGVSGLLYGKFRTPKFGEF